MTRDRINQLVTATRVSLTSCYVSADELAELCTMALRSLDTASTNIATCHADCLRARAERRAAIVAAAHEHGDSEAAKQFGVSRQLVCRYRLAATQQSNEATKEHTT